MKKAEKFEILVPVCRAVVDVIREVARAVEKSEDMRPCLAKLDTAADQLEVLLDHFE